MLLGPLILHNLDGGKKVNNLDSQNSSNQQSLLCQQTKLVNT